MGKKLAKTLIYSALPAIAFLSLDYYVHNEKKGTCEKHLLACSTYDVNWELPSSSNPEEINSILSQTFSYYSKGSQAFVFLSQDGQYILKLFKTRKVSPRSWLAYIPFSFNPLYNDLKIKQRKKQEIYIGGKCAYSNLKEESGLVFVHLNPSHDLPNKLHLIDKRGQKQLIDPNDYIFQLQYKAERVYPYITHLMEEKNIEGAQEAVSSLIALLVDMAKKGVYDNDPIIRRNFGYFKGRPIQIDVGKLKIDPKAPTTVTYRQDIPRVFLSMRRWMENTHPELGPYMDQNLSEIE